MSFFSICLFCLICQNFQVFWALLVIKSIFVKKIYYKLCQTHFFLLICVSTNIKKWKKGKINLQQNENCPPCKAVWWCVLNCFQHPRIDYLGRNYKIPSWKKWFLVSILYNQICQIKTKLVLNPSFYVTSINLMYNISYELN